MPEGPEITYFSVFLKKKLINCKLIEIKSFTDKPVILPKEWENNKEPNKLNKTIIDIDSKGKLLWIKFISGDEKSNLYMHVHYGITGWFTFDKPNSNIKFELIFKNEKTEKELNLYMEDKRRFSKINIYDQEEHDKIINKLGIDLFSDKFTLEEFKNKIKNKNTLLGAFLLKQDIFCGIGNYIKNEVLYMGKLKAKIKTSELDDKQIEKLYNDLLFVGYSNLIEMLTDSKIVKYLNKSKTTFMPKKLEIPYQYKIYSRETTLDGK
jgi:formamidopyrimidine-DNA glycosylase